MSEEEINELEDDISKKRKKSPDYRVEIVNVDERNPTDEGSLQEQLEAEKKRRKSAELIIEAEAMKEILKSRDSLLQRIPESRREQIRTFIGGDDPDPEKIESVKASLLLQGQDFGDDEDDNKPAPVSLSGRAMMLDSSPIESGRTTYQNPHIQKYSELYRIIRDPKTSAQEKSEAEQILDETFAEIRKGLKSRSRNDPYTLPSGIINHCYRCGMVSEIDLSKNPCPHCGYDFSKEPMPRNPKFEPR